MRKILLALSCLALLAPMFLVAVTSSAPYDAWSDLDADGDIDIFDVVKIAGAYGTTGDPTKDVNVINWPQTQNAYVTNWPAPQIPVWPEQLVLRGAQYGFWENYQDGSPMSGEASWYLIDENKPYPNAYYFNYSYPVSHDPYSTSWEQGTTLTFIHQLYPQISYQIRGDVPINIKFRYELTNPSLYDDYVYFNVTVTLGRISTDGYYYYPLSSGTVYVSQMVAHESNVDLTFPGATTSIPGVVLHFPSPVSISAGERLYISIDAWYRSAIGFAGGWFSLYHTKGTDELSATIQTTMNP